MSSLTNDVSGVMVAMLEFGRCLSVQVWVSRAWVWDTNIVRWEEEVMNTVSQEEVTGKMGAPMVCSGGCDLAHGQDECFETVWGGGCPSQDGLCCSSALDTKRDEYVCVAQICPGKPNGVSVFGKWLTTSYGGINSIERDHVSEMGMQL